MRDRFVIVRLIAIVLSALHPYTATADPLRADHPLIGIWRLDLPDRDCHELYAIHRDGTTLVTSGDEVGESKFVIADRPSANGFYKWVDKITKDNGKKDCVGQTMNVGHESTNYILLHHSGDMFLLCEQEDQGTCIGPLVRQKDNEI